MTALVRGWVRWVFVVGALAGSGCGSGSGEATPAPPAVTTRAPDPAPPPEAVAVPPASTSATLTCADRSAPTERIQAQLAVSRPEICVLDAESRTLRVEATGSSGDSIGVYVHGFTGAGAYTTGPNDESTTVSLRAHTSDGTTDVSTGGDDECPPRPCTITVTGAMPSIVLDVACPQLGGAGVDCVTCDLTPATLRLEPTGCES